MNCDVRGRRRRREEANEDLQPLPVLNTPEGAGTSNINDSPNHRRTELLLSAPLGQIDEYDGDRGAGAVDNMSPPKRSKRANLPSGGQLQPLHMTASATNSASSGLPPQPQESAMNQPTLPISAFVYFFRLERENLLDKAKAGGTQLQNLQEFAYAVEKKWETLRIEDRRIYDQLAANDEARYKREMEEYMQKQQLQLQSPNQGTGNGLRDSLLAALSSADSCRTIPITASAVATSNAAVHPDARLSHAANMISSLRSFPSSVTAAVANTSGGSVPSSVIAPTHQHFLPPGSAIDASRAMFPNRHTITPPQHHGIVGRQLPPLPPIHVNPSSNPSPVSNTAAVAQGSTSIALPAGMEIELSGRKYKVGYDCQYMTREDAQEFLKQYQTGKGASNQRESSLSAPPPS